MLSTIMPPAHETSNRLLDHSTAAGCSWVADSAAAAAASADDAATAVTVLEEYWYAVIGRRQRGR